MLVGKLDFNNIGVALVAQFLVFKIDPNKLSFHSKIFYARSTMKVYD